MEVVVIFTSKLKEARRSKGVIQDDVSAVLGIAKTTYSRKENNLIPFTHEELVLIKQFLKLTDSEFIEIFFENKVAFNATKSKK